MVQKLKDFIVIY